MFFIAIALLFFVKLITRLININNNILQACISSTPILLGASDRSSPSALHSTLTLGPSIQLHNMLPYEVAVVLPHTSKR